MSPPLSTGATLGKDGSPGTRTRLRAHQQGPGWWLRRDLHVRVTGRSGVGGPRPDTREVRAAQTSVNHRCHHPLSLSWDPVHFLGGTCDNLSLYVYGCFLRTGTPSACFTTDP